MSGWKPCRQGGGRYYNILLHNEEVGLSIEQQAQSEGILPHQVIESAIALRSEHNEKHSSSYVTVEREELNMVVTQARTLGGENRKLTRLLQQQERRITELTTQLTFRAAVVEDEFAISSGDRTEDHQEQVQASVPFAPTGHEGTASAATEEKAPYSESSYQKIAAENSSPPFDEASDRHIEQEESANPCATQAVSTGALDAGSDDKSSSHQLSEAPRSMEAEQIVQPLNNTLDVPEGRVTNRRLSSNSNFSPPQNVLPTIQTLRDFEAQLKMIDSQIQEKRSQLAQGNLGRQQEWELKDTLANREKLRATKIANMLTLVDSNGLRAIYDALRTKGRIVLEREYAATLLENARTWSEVELVVGSDRTRLVKAVKDWHLEQRQILVRLLSAYLETSPSALENIAWIPKKLLSKALSTLSFKVRIIDFLHK